MDLNSLGSDLSRAEGAVDELSLVVQVRGTLVVWWHSHTTVTKHHPSPHTFPHLTVKALSKDWHTPHVTLHLLCGAAGPVQGLAHCQGAG